jgi:hypothetical protein
MKHRTIVVLEIAFSALLVTVTVLAGPLDQGRNPHPQSAQVVHEAEHTVDHAWEVYHRAALGGTIASPAIQAKIEQHLHDARSLIAQAREAAERGDQHTVKRLVGRVKIHTTRAIEGSKEQKK